MAREAFNRKRSISCGLLKKELSKRLGKFFVWSVSLYGAETWTLRRNEQKDWKHLRCRYGACKNGQTKIKNAVVLEKVGEGRTMLELIKKRKGNCMDHCLEGTAC